MSRSARAGRSTASATASCSPRAARSWCSSGWRRLKRAVRVSTPSCSASGNRPMRTIWSRPTPRAAASRSRCAARCAMPTSSPAMWSTSTRTPRRRRWATTPNRRRSPRCSLPMGVRWRSARPRACTATRWVAPAGSRAWRRRWRCTTTSSRQRSTTNSPIPSARSTMCPTSRARRRCASRLRTQSGFAWRYNAAASVIGQYVGS